MKKQALRVIRGDRTSVAAMREVANDYIKAGVVDRLIEPDTFIETGETEDDSKVKCIGELRTALSDGLSVAVLCSYDSHGVMFKACQKLADIFGIEDVESPPVVVNLSNVVEYDGGSTVE